MQEVYIGGHAPYSTVIAASGSSKIPTSIESMYGDMFRICELDSSPQGDLCYKHVLLGLTCLSSYPSLLTCVLSVLVLSYQSGLCRSVGICCMGSGTLLLLCPCYRVLGVPRACLKVLVGWKDVIIPKGVRLRLMASEVFFTKRIAKEVFGGMASWLVGGGVLVTYLLYTDNFLNYIICL